MSTDSTPRQIVHVGYYQLHTFKACPYRFSSLYFVENLLSLKRSVLFDLWSRLSHRLSNKQSAGVNVLRERRQKWSISAAKWWTWFEWDIRRLPVSSHDNGDSVVSVLETVTTTIKPHVDYFIALTQPGIFRRANLASELDLATPYIHGSHYLRPSQTRYTRFRLPELLD